MRCKPTLPGVDWLRAGFSGREGGVSTVYGGSSLNLGWTKDDDAGCVRENRRRLVEDVWGADGWAAELVTLRQVHGAETRVVGRDDGPRIDGMGRTLLEGDGMMTDVGDLLLAIQTADCVPVLVADMRLRAVAAFHAGWRGTVKRIVERGLTQMREVYGSRAEDLVAAIGPAIGACCYAVSEEVQRAFVAEFAYAAELFDARVGRPRWELAEGGADAGGQSLYLDLHESNRRQLVDGGVKPERIEVLREECTACACEADGARRYFSHRAERGFTGRMMSVIGIAAL